MGAVYNEIDPYAAQWLRNLGAENVLEKSITDVQPSDVMYSARFHAFAGLGLWEYALRLAGWPVNVPVWTGSCPCQPFSVAGKSRGTNDPRHLWPEWFRLVSICRPPIIFGEQIASPLGRDWLDAVSTDLETLGYAVGTADLCAAGVGAPHLRQRLYFVAHTDDARSQRRRKCRNGSAKRVARPGGVAIGRVADPNCERSQKRRLHLRERKPRPEMFENAGGCSVGDFWSSAEWLECSDGKARPAQPGAFPLAYGDSSRVGKLRAYGNAIVPQVAAAFIEAAMESILPPR